MVWSVFVVTLFGLVFGPKVEEMMKCVWSRFMFEA